MLSRLYAKWMFSWETALTTRDTNRIVRPLEWGFDWLAQFLAARGLAGGRLRLLREVIELHDAPHRAPRASLETRLGHFGIGLDVLGVHREDLHRETLAAIVGAWPRGDFRHQFPRVIRDQAERKPWSHIARLDRLGLGARIAAAPVPDGAPA